MGFERCWELITGWARAAMAGFGVKAGMTSPGVKE